jgi:short-subunit dehydrogenase
MRQGLVVGGANGIGLSIATELAKSDEFEKIYIVDKLPVADEYMCGKFETYCFDLTNDDYSLFDRFTDIDTLMITAGFGRLALFRDVTEQYIIDSFTVNTVSAMRIIKRFYPNLQSENTFRCGVLVSIAGFMSSPFFSVYAATKAALKVFIESVNVELAKSGTDNRILNVSPGSIKGTSFSNGKTDLSLTTPLALQIIERLDRGDDLFIPMYDEVYREVLRRYNADFRAEGMHSYDYKVATGRVKV